MKIRNGFVSNSSSSSFVVVTNIKTMYNQTPSVNLQTAVLMQVQEFVNSGQTFSRYDITKALRQKCNDGLLEIPEVEDTDPSATNRFNVRKSDVDAIFEQLYQNCLVNGLPPMRYDYNPNLGYRVFSVDTTAPVSAPVPPPVNPLVSATPNYSTPIPVVVNPAVITSIPTNTVVLSDPEIRRRVSLYMSRCRNQGITPTLKQIQSAIKRGNKSTGLSYREIANVAQSLGYTV